MFVVYEIATGQPRSFGTVIANPLPDGLAVKELTIEETNGVLTGTLMFDAATLTMIPVPLVVEPVENVEE